MPILKILFFLFIIGIPMTSLGTELAVVLDVSIDPSAKRLSGTANLFDSQPREVQLAVQHLSNIRVNGKRIAAAADNTILVKVGKDRPTVVQYQVVFDGSPAGTIDAENVFLMGDWYPAPGTDPVTPSRSPCPGISRPCPKPNASKWPIARICPPICFISTIPWTVCTWQLPQTMRLKKTVTMILPSNPTSSGKTPPWPTPTSSTQTISRTLRILADPLPL